MPTTLIVIGSGAPEPKNRGRVRLLGPARPPRRHPLRAMRRRDETLKLPVVRLPWPVRSVLAGAAGTATMTLAYAAERRLRPSARGPLDYDDSLVPGKIVAAVMHLPHVTDREDQELGLLLRWSYGSAFGIAHGALHHRLREPAASAAFGGILMSATLSLFPLLGHTPPPWRWPRGMLATSVATHVAYVAAVATADDVFLRRLLA